FEVQQTLKVPVLNGRSGRVAGVGFLAGFKVKRLFKCPFWRIGDRPEMAEPRQIDDYPDNIVHSTSDNQSPNTDSPFSWCIFVFLVS
ncbi:MAG TPA: hypothetical protein VER68_08165, partial [Azonexus sp.]|nr:hypothetical protein [Azonexus sp.]